MVQGYLIVVRWSRYVTKVLSQYILYMNVTKICLVIKMP